MHVLLAIAALFLMQVLGEVMVRVTGLPVPGPLAGMLFLLAALILLGRVPAGLRNACHHLLKHLMLLFIPLVAGIMLHFSSLADEWIPFLLACVGGVAFTIAATALTFRWMLKRTRIPES